MIDNFSEALETIKWQSRLEKEPNKTYGTENYGIWNLNWMDGSNSRLEEVISEWEGKVIQISKETKWE